jgi:hypothetical protein
MGQLSSNGTLSVVNIGRLLMRWQMRSCGESEGVGSFMLEEKTSSKQRGCRVRVEVTCRVLSSLELGPWVIFLNRHLLGLCPRTGRSPKLAAVKAQKTANG